MNANRKWRVFVGLIGAVAFFYVGHKINFYYNERFGEYLQAAERSASTAETCKDYDRWLWIYYKKIYIIKMIAFVLSSVSGMLLVTEILRDERSLRHIDK